MKMNNIMTAMALSLVIGAVAQQANAADGTINFTGEITKASCVASAGNGTSIGGNTGSQEINVKLGTVSTETLSNSASLGIAAGAAINLNLDCGNTASEVTSVTMAFDPMSGSGVDTKNNSLLKTTGGATGVGIGVYDANSKLINLSANEGFTAALVKSGDGEEAKYTTNMNLRASYVANGDDLTPGSANGTLPFTLTYQ
ncbi:fimbrial protein [Enterobacter hormaechei]